jgi:hypothetical protein
MEELLEFPVQMSITGKTKSGKSYLLRHRILPLLIKKYEAIYIFSPTSKLDKEWRKYYKSLTDKQQDKFFLINEVDLDQIEELFDMIGDNKLEGSDDKHLLIFDDVTDLYSKSNRSIFSKLSFKGRHSNISYIFTTHKYNMLNTLVRSNVKTKIIFRTTNVHELKTFIEDNATIQTPKKELMTKMLNCTGDNKAFVIESSPNNDDYFCIEKNGYVKKA